VNLGLLVAGAFLLMGHLSSTSVCSAQFLIGGSGAFLAPTVAAITLGIVGAGASTTIGGVFAQHLGYLFKIGIIGMPVALIASLLVLWN
jgi:hypothetical protein